MSKSKPIVKRLKDEIRKAGRRGISCYRIAGESGVSRAQMSRLMAGTVAPRLDTAERIAHAIGLEIVIQKAENIVDKAKRHPV